MGVCLRMSKNSPHTFQTEAVVAASGPGEVAGAAGEREGERWCSCADDCENGSGRPCALQRHVPAVLRVRSESASDSVRHQRWDFSVASQRQVPAVQTFTVRCSSQGLLTCPSSWRWGAVSPGSFGAPLLLCSGGGTVAGRGRQAVCLLSAGV